MKMAPNQNIFKSTTKTKKLFQKIKENQAKADEKDAEV